MSFPVSELRRTHHINKIAALSPPVGPVQCITKEKAPVLRRQARDSPSKPLYAILRDDLDGTADIFRRHGYPGIGRGNQRLFVRELSELVEARRGLLPSFNYRMLKELLQIATKLDMLPFLEGELSNILIDEFSLFYIVRLCLFKNSTHIFDIEETIEARLNAETFIDGVDPLHNFRFVDSKLECGIQIADAVAGLLVNSSRSSTVRRWPNSRSRSRASRKCRRVI